MCSPLTPSLKSSPEHPIPEPWASLWIVLTFPVSYLRPALTTHCLHRNLCVPQCGMHSSTVTPCPAVVPSVLPFGVPKRVPNLPWLSHSTRASGVSNRVGNRNILHLYFPTYISVREYFSVVWLLMCFSGEKKRCPVISRFLPLEMLYSECFVLFHFLHYFMTPRSYHRLCSCAAHYVTRDHAGSGRIGLIISFLKPELYFSVSTD